MREPDLQGVARAWKFDPSPESDEAHRKEFGYDHANIRQWFVNGPYHPLWSWWMVSMIHLRDIEGAPPAVKQYDDAEFEFCVWSLEGTPNLDMVAKGELGNKGFTFLHPADVTFQFDGLTDEQAAKICDAAVQVIVQGQSCDSDYRQWWLGMLANTVQHYKDGIHT